MRLSPCSLLVSISKTGMYQTVFMVRQKEMEKAEINI